LPIIYVICKLLKYKYCNIGNCLEIKDIEASALQEGMLIFIVNFVKDKNDVAEMAKSFKALDINGDGVVSLDELQKGLGKYMSLNETQSRNLAKQIFAKVDLNNSGAIDFSCNFKNYTEFLICASNIELTVSE
jgi:Ca2+-binding EF-hand superfamily protein